MADAPEPNAWLEKPDGSRIPVHGNCSIGRSRTNHLVLGDSRVSRRHTLIHAQGDHEFWIVDFGSVNGTRVNNRRVSHPTALKDLDTIEIADTQLVFHAAQPAPINPADIEATAVTAREIKTIPSWLLIADIIGSTRLTHTVPADELPVLFGKWFSLCSEVLGANQGSINKYLGDGFFAFWPEPPDHAQHVCGALNTFTEAQKTTEPRFRLVLHHGNVSTAGSQGTGEESLVGNQIHFVFRMEKLAGALDLAVLLSESAARRLAPLQTFREIGQYPLSGFDGTFPFYSL